VQKVSHDTDPLLPGLITIFGLFGEQQESHEEHGVSENFSLYVSFDTITAIITIAINTPEYNNNFDIYYMKKYFVFIYE
jgi:hypothetical protein